MLFIYLTILFKKKNFMNYDKIFEMEFWLIPNIPLNINIIVISRTVQNRNITKHLSPNIVTNNKSD